jgi:hypothetical protein
LIRLAALVPALAIVLVALAMLVPLTTLTTACVSDAGAASGDGSCQNDGGQTLSDQCLTVYTELCKQGARCNIPVSSISDCANNDVAQFCPCSGSACSNESCQQPAQVTACIADIDSEDCDLVANNSVLNPNTPADCAPFTNAM